MPYTPKTWENKPSTASPINATNLNHMEGGIKTNDDNITDAQNAILTLQGEMLQAQGDISALETLVDSIFPVDTESGNPAVITDAFGGACKSLVLTLEPIQSGSGTPSPTNVRPISGRTQSVLGRYNKYNFFSPLAFTSESKNGITVTYEGNGTYRVKGTSTSSTDFSFTTIPIEPFIIYGGDNREVKFNNTANMPNVRLYFYEEDGTPIDSWGLSPLNASNTAYNTMRNKRIGRFLVSIGSALYGTSIDFTFKVEIMDNTDKSSITRTYGTTIYGGTDDVTGDGTVSDMEKLTQNDATRVQNLTALTNTTRLIIQLPSTCNYAGRARAVSNYLPYEEDYSHDTPHFYISNENTYIAFFPGVMTGDQWRAYVASNPLEIAYPVATPTSIPLTAQNITLLHGDNVLTTDADNIEASYSADIALYIEKKISEGSNNNRSVDNSSLTKGGSGDEEPKEEEKEEIKEEEIEIKEEEPLTKEVR